MKFSLIVQNINGELRPDLDFEIIWLSVYKRAEAFHKVMIYYLIPSSSRVIGIF